MPLSFAEIISDLTARIHKNEFADGKLPSYSQLAEQYGVSYTTIYRVITVLQAQNIVRGEPGRGVYVVST